MSLSKEGPVLVCRAPYVNSDGNVFGCGQCMACRVKKASEWKNRLILEMNQHVFTTFVTLTYNPEHLPPCAGHPGGTLVPDDLQKYLKRLRYRLGEVKFRFFACGEYGDKSGRAHYHLLLFGIHPCDDIRDAWSVDGVPLGFVEMSIANSHRCGYIAQYVCKKMTNGKKKEVQEWLKGRTPEFTRMSLKPGIGAGAVPALAESLFTYGGSKYMAALGDVPYLWHYDGRSRLIGKYLRGKIRDVIGMPSPGKNSPALIAQKEKLRFLFSGPFYHSPFARLHASHVLAQACAHDCFVREYLQRKRSVGRSI